MSLPRFFAPDAGIVDGPIRLPDDESHHLRHVLRLGVGASLAVFDGAGREWDAAVARIERHAVFVDLTGTRAPAAEPPVRVTLALAVLKGDQMDAAVRDATMLGAFAIQPLATAHVSVPERAWRQPAAVERWRRVAIASAKQCGRAVVPSIPPVATLDQVMDGASEEVIVICVEPAAGVAADLGALAVRPASALALVGPEGGWSAEEIAKARARGARAVSLGPRRLRAETVPPALLSVLWTGWGW